MNSKFTNSSESYFKVQPFVILLPIVFLALMWIVYMMEWKMGWNFNGLGVYPRRLDGLIGVITGPFIHGSAKHLFNNSIPFVILSMSLLYFFQEEGLRIFILGWVLSGIGTWLIGRPSHHIGASGVVYFLFGFLFLSGLIRKNIRLTALSLALCFLYGGMIWYVFPIEADISWEGHSSGLLVGFALAILWRQKGPKSPKHIFKKTEFDEFFDEYGNLRESLPESLIEESTTSDRDI
ncbi:MAG: rhomboid family intramembrane serine protease [Flavobacteriaceae bacterium]